MIIHLLHNWKHNGFEIWGSYTNWFYKCGCGANYSSFREHSDPERMTFKLMTLISVGITGGFFLFTYLIS